MFRAKRSSWGVFRFFRLGENFSGLETVDLDRWSQPKGEVSGQNRGYLFAETAVARRLSRRRGHHARQEARVPKTNTTKTGPPDPNSRRNANPNPNQEYYGSGGGNGEGTPSANQEYYGSGGGNGDETPSANQGYYGSGGGHGDGSPSDNDSSSSDGGSSSRRKHSSSRRGSHHSKRHSSSKRDEECKKLLRKPPGFTGNPEDYKEWKIEFMWVLIWGKRLDLFRTWCIYSGILTAHYKSPTGNKLKTVM